MNRTTLLGMVTVVAVLACMPMKAAYAYIDPNSAGALYQFLFPLLIAIGSAFAFLRRMIVRACTRLAGAVMSVVRGGRAKDPPGPGRSSGNAR
jgi:hypothetical protein